MASFEDYQKNMMKSESEMSETISGLRVQLEEKAQEIAAKNEKIANFIGKITAFVNDIKSRTTIYSLVKNLSLWKELEALIEDSENEG